MDIFVERTLCLLSPTISSITASTFLPGSTSRGSRSRTRMGTSMERNFYTFILLSLVLVILILSPSASANRCTPTFSIISDGDEVEYYESNMSSSSSTSSSSSFEEARTRVTIREQASFKLNCSLSVFHSVKWTISGREVTPQLQDEWDIDILNGKEMEGYIYTELRVNNASQKHHAGEYRCTSQCMSDTPGANIGVTVSINIAINVTIAGSKPGLDPSGVMVYRRYVAREKSVDIVCKAPVPNAQMTWYRIKDDKQEEDMDTVCLGPDVELAEKIKKPKQHCVITHGGNSEESTIILKFNRARKEGIEAKKTISDFRRYVCKATKEGNQDGSAIAELFETVSADRKFERGERSVSVIEGNELHIFCDFHGVSKKEFDDGSAKVAWQKDGQTIQIEDLKNVKKIAEVGPEDRGKPYRVGFTYDMAEPEHRGQYTCELVRNFAPDPDSSKSTKVNFTYYVRVKDKLGALWPFLGICGEVVVLCTIILIYEKRRNKTELDESDTDGSPDQ